MQKRIVKILHHKVDELCQKKINVKVLYGGLIVLKWCSNQKVIEHVYFAVQITISTYTMRSFNIIFTKKRKKSHQNLLL